MTRVDAVTDASPDVERWRAIAAATPRVARRRRMWLAVLVLLGGPGLAWLATIGWWGLRARWPVFWVVIVAHLVALGLAVGPPVRAGRADAATGDALARLRAGHAARATRLRVLCGALLVELLGNVAWSAGWALLVEPPFRLGPGFTTALATLWLAWPLQRIAAAQHDEASRLDVASMSS